MYTPDGDVHWQRWTDRALFDEKDNLYQYQSIGFDITESKKVEQALRISEERFREMAELMPMTVFESDIIGNLTFANRKAFDSFGYSQEDFDRGVNSLDMLVPEDRQQAAENIAKIMNHRGKPSRFAGIPVYARRCCRSPVADGVSRYRRAPRAPNCGHSHHPRVPESS